MSKAFLRESDAPDLPELRPLAPPVPPGTKNYLTAGGALRLRTQLEELITRVRPPLAARADDADAKRELQTLDQRIRYLEQSLRTAEVVSPPALHDVVRFGARVTVRDAGGAETAYRIVGVDEADPDRGGISWLSPIARALLNTTVGQRITIVVPRGKWEWEIVRIEYPDV